jgi:transcriptional regulator GlxA family with amidase domain
MSRKWNKSSQQRHHATVARAIMTPTLDPRSAAAVNPASSSQPTRRQGAAQRRCAGASPEAAAGTRRLGFLLLPQFSMMAFSAAIEPLRAANRLRGKPLYEWNLASVDGSAVVASNGISIAVQGALGALGHPDMLVVCVGLDALQLTLAHPRLKGQLRQLAAHGCQVGGVSGGSFLLAEAGLLDGRRCSVHWEYAELFAQRYARARLVPDLFVVDDGVFTCSGGTAALDLMLHFIREHHGGELANAVAEQFIHPRIREQSDDQRMDSGLRYRITHPRLADAVRLMESALGKPLGLAGIADRVGLSPRQIERLFAQQLGTTPGQFHLGLRLARGRHLLRETAAPVRAIAEDCGFDSASHFSQAYKRLHGCRPSDERRRLRPTMRIPAP